MTETQTHPDTTCEYSTYEIDGTNATIGKHYDVHLSLSLDIERITDEQREVVMRMARLLEEFVRVLDNAPEWAAVDIGDMLGRTVVERSPIAALRERINKELERLDSREDMGRIAIEIHGDALLNVLQWIDELGDATPQKDTP